MRHTPLTLAVLTVLGLALLFHALPLRAEEEAPPATFPASWVGTWEGPAVLVQGGKTTRNFLMGLDVRPTDQPGVFTWVITYGEGERAQRRPYELHTVSAATGHFQIDEKNGIVLDSWFENDRLHNRFWVMNNVIEATYRRVGDRMEVDLTTYGDKPLTMTGGKDRVPPVASYALKTIQRAELQRDKK